MGLQRTSFLAVIVTEEQLPEAIDFYCQAFDMNLSARSPMGARLTGLGFTIFLRVGDASGLVLQEFEVSGEGNPEKRLLDLGCELVPVDGQTRTSTGFFVKDPYGMTFQVYHG